MLVRALYQECASKERCATALATVATLLSNVLECPADETFRSVRLSNRLFHERVGQFASGVELLRAAGFEDARAGDAPPDGPCTHLAIPTADAARLARHLVLLEAARQALDIVDDEVNPAAPVAEPGARPSGALGKRPATTSPQDSRPSRDPRQRVPTPAGEAVNSPEPVSHAGPSRPSHTGPRGDGAKGASVVGDKDRASHEGTLELTDFSADGIDAFFERHFGAEGELLEDLHREEGGMQRPLKLATDALRVATVTANAAAQRRASFWLKTVREFVALLGDRAHGLEHHDGDADEVDVVVGADGNLEVCSICSEGGELVCCDGCPQAFHAECLGPAAPDLDDDDGDGKNWFCPTCAEVLAESGAQPGGGVSSGPDHVR